MAWNSYLQLDAYYLQFFSVLVAVCGLAIFTLGEMDQGQTHITPFDSDVSYLKTSYPRFEIPFFYLLKEHLHFTLSFP